MVETLYSYLWVSINETPGILRMTNGHPYGNRDMLRIWMTFIGKVSGGVSPLGRCRLRLSNKTLPYNMFVEIGEFSCPKPKHPCALRAL